VGTNIVPAYGFLFIEMATMSETSWFFHSLEQLLFYEIFFSDVKSKIIQSVQLLHGKIKAGAKIIPTRRFSHSNGIGLIEVAPGAITYYI